MKFIFSTLFLTSIIVLSSCIEKNFNDLDEYGLKGNIKTVRVKVYKDLPQQGDHYLVDENYLAVERLLIFDVEGNLETWESWYLADDKILNNARVKFFHKDGKKWKSVLEDSSDSEDATYFIWKNEFEYDFGDTTESGVIYNTHTFISETNGRDLSGEYKAWSDGELIGHDDYINELDGNRILSTTMHDYIENTTNVYEVVYLKEDNHGNPTEYYIFDTKNGELKEYYIREIEYH